MRCADGACGPGWATRRAGFYITFSRAQQLGQSNVQQQRIAEIAVSSQYVKLVKHTKQVYCAYIEPSLSRSETVQKLR